MFTLHRIGEYSTIQINPKIPAFYPSKTTHPTGFVRKLGGRGRGNTSISIFKKSLSKHHTGRFCIKIRGGGYITIPTSYHRNIPYPRHFYGLRLQKQRKKEAKKERYINSILNSIIYLSYIYYCILILYLIVL